MKKNVIINNKTGLHARPASIFVHKASQYQARIELLLDEKIVNGKSIMGVMSLGAKKGTEIIIRAEGDDAEKAVIDLVDFIENDFIAEEE